MKLTIDFNDPDWEEKAESEKMQSNMDYIRRNDVSADRSQEVLSMLSGITSKLKPQAQALLNANINSLNARIQEKRG